MFATVHNAMADRGNGFVLLPNQNRPLEEALEEGYRALNLDVCNCGGNHVFCHGLCQTGQRAIDEVLTNIVSFLVANPTEVVLLPIELNSEADQPVDIMALSNILQNVPNAQNMLYIHDPNATAWPTLQTLINDNKVSWSGKTISYTSHSERCACRGFFCSTTTGRLVQTLANALKVFTIGGTMPSRQSSPLTM